MIQNACQHLSAQNLKFQPSALRVMVIDAGYKHCSSPILSYDPVVDNCYMPELQPFNTRKRQCTEPCELQSNGTSQHQLKRQKLNQPIAGSQPTSAFWDNLSKIWLTKSALRHLNWRNSQLVSSQPRSRSQRLRRPVTRNFLAKLERSRPVTQSASDFLRYCKPGTFEDIKRFARTGGPDLSDLKGVSIMKYPPTII